MLLMYCTEDFSSQSWSVLPYSSPSSNLKSEAGANDMVWESGFSVRWTTLVTCALAGAVVALAVVPANAQFYVRSPDVEKGELKLEEHGAIYSGPGEDER